MLHLILGGTALQRCCNCIVRNAALAAEGTVLAQNELFAALLIRVILGVFYTIEARGFDRRYLTSG
jgi:hypothetical protein